MHHYHFVSVHQYLDKIKIEKSSIMTEILQQNNMAMRLSSPAFSSLLQTPSNNNSSNNLPPATPMMKLKNSGGEDFDIF